VETAAHRAAGKKARARRKATTRKAEETQSDDDVDEAESAESVDEAEGAEHEITPHPDLAPILNARRHRRR
jgi:hypothetical protein